MNNPHLRHLMTLEFWPYVVCAVVVVLGGLFAQGRIALLAVLLAVFTLLLSWFGLHRHDPFRLDVAIFSASVYVPSLTAIFIYLRERGLWNSNGALRSTVVIMALFFFFIIAELLLAQLPLTIGTGSFRQEIWLRRVAPWLPLPLTGLLALAAATVALQLRRRTEDHKLRIFLGTMILAVFVALSFRSFTTNTSRASAIFFGSMTTAALCLLAAVIEGVWRHAFIDELTELPSRRALRHHFVSLGGDYIIAIIDIDHFKSINDRYGHATGDQVLRFVASILKTNTIGRAYRQGGEEFVVVVENIQLPRALEMFDALRASVAARPFGIRDLQARPVNIDETPPPSNRQRRVEMIQMTISIGVAHASHGSSPEEVLAVADKALYRAKQDGRNLVRVGNNRPPQEKNTTRFISDML